ncbi:S-adenosyl-L-methionine-dependent methyltransferase [Penicillium macrosclerotiorum]|uniref:S-adenosyl-L-methionine-dependent methyltransferase n=1 Tax=Penicillium macrosclerotiorum TaxID=303699 RepID=UPI0025484025|nr:S-adenosyl-L-methionine-dependent methyltransferase [Penicillium macrosclerotiorum]KAJ5698050.1 S-adenosyl-L-methionine-dependent methyltransferase [Penicillium macrosclerotiorum]
MSSPGRLVDSDGIEVDADVSSSSDFDSIQSDLTSLTESIYSHVYENGRTYHAYRSGTYKD